MKVRPRIVNGENFTHVTFGFNLHDPEHGEDLQPNLEEFLKTAHEMYYARHAKQQDIAESVRRVDYEQLAALMLTRFDSMKESTEGDCEACVHFQIEIRENPAEVGHEMISYTLHFHSDAKDVIEPIFPIGFQMFYSYYPTPSGVTARVVFDTRVTHRQLQDSYEFYVDKCLPGMEPYFEYMKNFFEMVSKNDYNVDINALKEKLKEVLTDYYERRLNNPADKKRMVLFLDAALVGNNKPDEILIRYDLILKTEETSTPELPISDEKHLTKVVFDNLVLASFASTRTTEVPEEPTQIRVSAKTRQILVGDDVQNAPTH